MKLNPWTFSNESNDKISGRRKRELDAVRIDTAIKTALDELGNDAQRRAAFLRLLECVRSRTPLLKPTSGRGTPGWVAPVFLVNRLKNLAARQSLWFRPCESWQPQGGNLRPAFRSLAHHLLARYPVPGFMDSVWDLAAGPEGFRQQAWYIRLARGASFRALNLPLPLSRKMAHILRHAPDHYSVAQAFRYAEVLGLGGSEALAREVVLGWLGQHLQHPDFWRTVLTFFLGHPQLQLEHVNPIVDFVQAQKYAGEEVLTGNGAGLRTPPWPEFSMKGRSLNALLRLVRAWHADLSASGPTESVVWRKSGIAGYRYVEKCPGEELDRDWTIQELVDSGALRAEGRAMRHCVYNYVNRCRRGETTVWSLRLRVNGQEKRVATIEVDPRRRAIIQARAKCNQRPGIRCGEIIRQWAAWAGLQLALNA